MGVALATWIAAACGGDNGDDEAAPVAAAADQARFGRGHKVLFVGVDGATYDAWHRGVADKSLPGLAQLTLSRAWTGGVNGARRRGSPRCRRRVGPRC